jgi:hypothetical protein
LKLELIVLPTELYLVAIICAANNECPCSSSTRSRREILPQQNSDWVPGIAWETNPKCNLLGLPVRAGNSQEEIWEIETHGAISQPLKLYKIVVPDWKKTATRLAMPNQPK